MSLTSESTLTADKENCRKELFKKLSASNIKPEIKEQVNHFETAFVVLKPGTDKVICYCNTREDADMVALSIKMSHDIAIGFLVEKIID